MSAFGTGFPELHEARGQGPEPIPGMNGAFAQKDVVLPDGDGSDHHQRVLVMDRTAVLAKITYPVIVRRYAAGKPGTALRAVDLRTRCRKIRVGASELLHALHSTPKRAHCSRY